MYKLLIVKVLPSDQGEMYCEAVEWIQDPDKTWKDIAWKQTSKAALTVKSLGKIHVFSQLYMLSLSKRLHFPQNVRENHLIIVHMSQKIAYSRIFTYYLSVLKGTMKAVLIKKYNF